ncbi:inactive protein RESTRICTED TEV MOVEMENT 2-like [Gossypium australe]|uniref:Inactive protein RESTRICTED TEV MOVEMENT 2-like n=1 Tax=Gossypium australe TaxID=47621 RepID=A0A5B6V2D9_9ROSI|nr:inactive protein RESTRICTED TEV MOVEMENT 2-like [Gossypium australe]
MANLFRQKIVPSSDWTHDDKASFLLVDLPGFKKEELRLELASTGHIIISGERRVDENKSVYFEESFEVPENSDTDNINAKFDGDFLHVTLPKLSHGNCAANGLGETTVQKQTNIDHPENQSKREDDQEEQQPKGEAIGKEACRVASFPKETLKKWEEDESPLEMAMNFLKKNKGAVVSVVIAFAVGVFVCRTFD